MRHWIHYNRGLCHILMQVGHVAPLRWLSVFVCLLFLLRLLSWDRHDALDPLQPWSQPRSGLELPAHLLLQVRSGLGLPAHLLLQARSRLGPPAHLSLRVYSDSRLVVPALAPAGVLPRRLRSPRTRIRARRTGAPA